MGSINIGMIIFDDFTDLDFFLPWDILNRVRILGINEHWNVHILANRRKVTSGAGLLIEATGDLQYSADCDALFFCSGPRAKTLYQDPEFLKDLRISGRPQLFAAIDSGALFLGSLGLLKNKRATTYPTVIRELEKFCEVVSEPFVAQGNIATASRCLSGTQLALWIIEKLTDQASAQRVLQTIEPL